ncbi:MAG TPA: hypothetical protein DCE42_26540 [Myxococcales bacterium]|nr:hypothetical protein [Deltaproteobacteria bacterium]HAA58349.1 hypothetical protein [Myxococcales bacterium]
MIHPTTSSRPLLFQCPLCKELTTLTRAHSTQQGFTLHCDECDKEVFYPTDTEASKNATEHTLTQTLIHPSTSVQKESESVPALHLGNHVDKASSVVVGKSAPDVDEPVVQNSTPEVDEPAGRSCPKCGFQNDEETESCPKCGLLYSNVGVTFRDAFGQEAESAEEKTAMELWEKVLKDWDNRQCHEAFVQWSLQHELFDLAATCYRHEKMSRGGADPIADEQLERIVGLVQQQFLMMQQREESRGKGNGQLWILLAFGFAFAMIMYYMLQSMSTFTPR